MSEKRAKQERKNDKELAEKIIVDIHIKINGKGQMMIDGFPENPYQGMDMMVTAAQMVVRKYHELAMQKVPGGNGKKIITLKKPLVGPDGKRIN